jgi:hypothetical protein
VGLKRKLERDYAFDLTTHGNASIKYKITGAYLSNSKVAPVGVVGGTQSLTYLPRPMGGEYVFSNVEVLGTRDLELATHTAFVGNPDFPRDFATRSVLFPLPTNPDHRADYLLSQLDDALKEEGGLRAVGTDRFATTVAGRMLTALDGIATNTDTMQYTKPTMNSFFTSDYQVIICEIEGEKEFKSTSHDYNILVHRKTAFAALKTTIDKHTPHMIPLFEEAVVYVQKKENSVFKNTSRCLVLSSKPDGDDLLHVFGDNAFSLVFAPKINTSSDRHQASMKNTGIVVGILEKVRRMPHGTEKESEDLEKKMFDFLVSDTVATANLTKIVQNERQDAINNASVSDKTEMQARHDADIITNGHLLSRSFLANQLRQRAITTNKKGKTPLVQFWVASATFSIIAIRIHGKALTYGFLQTYPFKTEPVADEVALVVHPNQGRGSASTARQGSSGMETDPSPHADM